MINKWWIDKQIKRCAAFELTQCHIALIVENLSPVKAMTLALVIHIKFICKFHYCILKDIKTEKWNKMDIDTISSWWHWYHTHHPHHFGIKHLHSRGAYSSAQNYCTLFNNPNSHRTVESLVMPCSENGRELFQANLNSLLFGKFRGLWTKE